MPAAHGRAAHRAAGVRKPPKEEIAGRDTRFGPLYGKLGALASGLNVGLSARMHPQLPRDGMNVAELSHPV
jgi:hypothetical protein